MPSITDFKANKDFHSYYTQIGQSFFKNNTMYERVEQCSNGRSVSLLVRIQSKEAKLHGALQQDLPHLAFICGKDW